MPAKTVCMIEARERPLHPCGRGYPGSNYCTTHHVRFTKHGDPYADVPIDRYRGKTLAEQRAALQTTSA